MPRLVHHELTTFINGIRFQGFIGAVKWAHFKSGKAFVGTESGVIAALKLKDGETGACNLHAHVHPFLVVVQTGGKCLPRATRWTRWRSTARSVSALLMRSARVKRVRLQTC